MFLFVAFFGGCFGEFFGGRGVHGRFGFSYYLVGLSCFFLRTFACLLMLPAGFVTKPYIESDASTWCDPRSFFLNSILGGLLFPTEEIVFLFLLFSNMLSNYFTLSINNLGK